ncbi:MAG: hypothetical protein J5915_12425 [Acidaminococcaceae bacterium]|nr:hypothetical protein [Acidaminococcaceae bacterium]MBR1660750.1 hypothetical protein [Acidaminococcaceae bacterium]
MTKADTGVVQIEYACELCGKRMKRFEKSALLRKESCVKGVIYICKNCGKGILFQPNGEKMHF